MDILGKLGWNASSVSSQIVVAQFDFGRAENLKITSVDVGIYVAVVSAAAAFGVALLKYYKKESVLVTIRQSPKKSLFQKCFGSSRRGPGDSPNLNAPPRVSASPISKASQKERDSASEEQLLAPPPPPTAPLRKGPIPPPRSRSVLEVSASPWTYGRLALRKNES